ncbi:hypothetical protein [Ralstonia pseudosolanacearum]|uniref:hypothetical protein n=1 Tax=Ralstonia pseudosolanacearum TaxID=1310165 RepID=UPI003CEF23A7
MTEQVVDGANHPGNSATTRIEVSPAAQPVSGPAALIGWLSIAAGVAGCWWGLYQERGPRGFEIALVALIVSSLSAFVAGVVTLAGRRWIQGALLVVGGMGLVGIAVLFVIAVGSVPYFHG